MKLMFVAESSFRRGLELLDEKLPDWYDRINVDTLDMEDPDHCILGQIGNTLEDQGSMLAGLHWLELYDVSIPMEKHGFDISFDIENENEEAGYGELRQLWVQAVEDRRNRS